MQFLKDGVQTVDYIPFNIISHIQRRINKSAGQRKAPCTRTPTCMTRLTIGAATRENWSSVFPNRSDTNWPMHLQKMATEV